MMLVMRTTLTIDDDLARELREKAHKTGSPFKEVVNKAIRAGLEDMDKPRQIKPYKCKTYSLGYPPSADLDHALNLANRLESEEIARKLSLRK
jgi:metal-responsive CopG/Arc/MetJ family transcriptional regulator